MFQGAILSSLIAPVKENMTLPLCLMIVMIYAGLMLVFWMTERDLARETHPITSK